MKYKHILLDLDGTISDPKIGITKSVQYALNKMGIIENDLDKLEPFIGPPLKNSFIDIYSFSEGRANQAVEYYREYFKEYGMYENELYPGMLELLENFQNSGFTLYVATSKPTVFAKQILKYFQIEHYFEWIVGSNLDGTMSDKSEIINYIIKNKEISIDSLIMIGDRKHDIVGANNNGIASIGVGYGYGSEEELRKANCTYYINKLDDIVRVVS
ncbi:HAD family hydrolase [Cohnella sp. GCM10027633]|uniref:HAD family hydrolase n=1 Tax=unclassified Cohnella TaxID=2636738 RepID=UPI00363E8D8D